MAAIALKLSARQSKESGKSEILLRYRNTREVALRAHTHVYVLPEFFVDGDIVIKNRIVTPEVREAQEAKVHLDRIVAHINACSSRRNSLQKTVIGTPAVKRLTILSLSSNGWCLYIIRPKSFVSNFWGAVQNAGVLAFKLVTV